MRKHEMHILVVDDNPSDRKLMAATLKSMGLTHIQIAENGQIADFKIHNANSIDTPFHLILLDWEMPNANGLALLKAIRQNPTFKNTIVFMVTGTAISGRVQEAIDAGVNDFIVKPITPALLEDKLKIFFKFGP